MSLTTSIFTRDGTTYPLPPQTTPFSYHYSAGGKNPCNSASFYCPFIVGEESPPYDGLVCTQGFPTTISGTTSFATQLEQCFPPSFFKIFETDPDADPVYPEDRDILTLAYPGSACIQDWATACTWDIAVTLTGATKGTVTSRQAWCCAPGYQCTTASVANSAATAAGSAGQPAFERQCYSYLNSQTEVWASWDPPATGTDDGKDYYTWPTSITWQPPKDKYTVYHKPLPLAVSSWTKEEEKGERVTRTVAAPDAAAGAEPTK